jgi:large subunit ribosomal protein L23
MKDPRDIILAPVVSEKSYALIEQGVYTFKVHPRSAMRSRRSGASR